MDNRIIVESEHVQPKEKKKLHPNQEIKEVKLSKLAQSKLKKEIIEQNIITLTPIYKNTK